MTDDRIARLIRGSRDFRKREYTDQLSRMRELAEGQSPEILMISCMDSRVEPALIFDTEPGQMFTVRNVANLVPPFRSGRPTLDSAIAAVEFAVVSVGVSHVVVMGHSRCRGIELAMEAASGYSSIDSEPIGEWLETAAPVCRRILDDTEVSDLDDVHAAARHAGQESVNNSIRNLLSYPWISDRVESGDLELHGWWFEIETGYLWGAKPDGTFMPLDRNPASGPE
ncbi:MAG: carbonic anhydrase [Gammaproteobacteria bacterium]|nr:carbonic anhydrase [Gammaproteobacteria bacterium]MYD76688.1 carbonic anhydrase [Gammaproteobacteria bacterium]MYJ53281.1 carbonic anhydrase [Gammaproteobacteria bacterium]